MSRRAGLAGLLTAEAVSLTGSRMTFVALPWLVLVTTGSATKTRTVAFAEMLPDALACAVGGPFVDRLGSRRTSISMDLVSVMVVGSIVVLSRSGGPSLTVLVGLVAAAGGARGSRRHIEDSHLSRRGRRRRGEPGAGDHDQGRTRPGRDAGRRTGRRGPDRGHGRADGTARRRRVVRPGRRRLGLAVPALANPIPDPAGAHPGTAAGQPRRFYLGHLREGFAYLHGDRLAISIMIMLFVANLADQAYATVLVPVWAKEIFGSPVGLGLTFAAFAVGAVLGNAGYTAVAPRLPRFWPFAVGFAVAGAPRFVTLAVAAPLWMVMTIAFTAGLGVCAVNPIPSATYDERVPGRLHARVLGLSRALSFAGIPLGSLLGGLLVDGAGVRVALLISGGVYGIATMLPFTSRIWRELDRPAPAGARAAGSPPGQPDRQDGQRRHAGR